MSDYRRYFVPGGTFFFTVVAHQRRKLFRTARACRLLGATMRECRIKWPYETVAIVLLPDHLHVIWSLPPGDDRYSARLGWIKKEFSKAWIPSGKREARRNERGELDVWQRRFWEHTIEDEDDLERHADYIHYNPRKHGLVKRPMDWPYSSFRKFVRLGSYEESWGADRPLDFSDLDETAME